MKDETTYIYVIAPKESDGPCKIGVTNSPASRLRTVQTGNPHDVEYIMQYRLPSRSVAFTIETDTHNYCNMVRLTGEWFDMTKLAAIRALHRTVLISLQKFYKGNQYEDVLHDAITWDIP